MLAEKGVQRPRSIVQDVPLRASERATPRETASPQARQKENVFALLYVEGGGEGLDDLYGWGYGQLCTRTLRMARRATDKVARTSAAGVRSCL